VSYWIKALGTINEIMELLGEVQKKWSFLENLFIHSEEVKKELPTESETFVGIDVQVKQVLKDGCSTKNCLKFCCGEGLLGRLEQVCRDLEICEKALMEFLNSKKNAFPRFYFVSTEDLLDILSNGNNPAKINAQGHISKVF